MLFKELVQVIEAERARELRVRQSQHAARRPQRSTRVPSGRTTMVGDLAHSAG